MDYAKEASGKHREWRGKIETKSRVPVNSKEELSVAYTPGVAAPCLEIQKEPELSYELTRRGNMCLVVTDGTAVLGLGDIGPEASMPVMEGKCVLFKEFGDVDAFPLCINSKDPDEIVNTIYLISKSFGAINLEDISAPRCFEIEKKLKAKCEIPVFHDDQHGTAVVTLAGLLNALKVTDRKPDTTKVVINGAGSAGIAIGKLLIAAGFKNILMCDKNGILCPGVTDGMNHYQVGMALRTNSKSISGNLVDALKGADVFIGVSAPGVVTKEMVKSMNASPIVFACANPDPEITPEDAKSAGAKVVACGRSDYNNQINNVLAFPGIIKGALEVRAKEINDQMKLAAAHALAALIPAAELSEDHIIPAPFDKRVCVAVSQAVKQAAIESGVARIIK